MVKFNLLMFERFTEKAKGHLACSRELESWHNFTEQILLGLIGEGKALQQRF